MAGWTLVDMPEQHGKVYLVTGANSGTGFCAAQALAQKGAQVIMACRDRMRGEAALGRIRAVTPEAKLELLELDLADLASVRAASAALGNRPLDGLLNNAGVMAVPKRQTTRQGHEMQVGTNHLGHFALTQLLLDNLVKRPHSRVVTVSSNAHRGAQVSWLEELQSERSYNRWRAYMLSKLCNLLFAFELQRRLRAQGRSVISLGAHPGTALTHLQHAGPAVGGKDLQSRLLAMIYPFVSQSAERGALPLLYALTAPSLQGGEYVGPDGLFGTRGYPTVQQPTAAARDPQVSRSLWDVSCGLLMAGGMPVSVVV